MHKICENQPREPVIPNALPNLKLSCYTRADENIQMTVILITYINVININ